MSIPAKANDGASGTGQQQEEQQAPPAPAGGFSSESAALALAAAAAACALGNGIAAVVEFSSGGLAVMALLASLAGMAGVSLAKRWGGSGAPSPFTGALEWVVNVVL